MNEAVRNYQGLGYVNFGTSSAASLRGRVQVPSAGSYQFLTRYAVAGADVGTIDVYVNGVRAGSPVFTQTPTASDWAVVPLAVTLQAGVNTIEFRARAAAPASVYIDNVALQQ